MYDARTLREEKDRIRRGVERKLGTVPPQLDRFHALDEERLTLLKEAEALKHERNQASEEIANDAARVGTQLGTMLMASAMNSGYGRSQEDQADRVGLRYAYQGGYEVETSPFADHAAVALEEQAGAVLRAFADS